MSNATNSCHGCGHIFYNDFPMSDGRCRYCHEDGDDKCIYCGRTATCSGSYGYMCHSQECARSEDMRSQRDWDEKYGDDWN